MGTRAADAWLPDFCRTPMLFAAMLIAAGVALAASLAPGSPGFTLGEFATNCLFAIWLTLVCSITLCVLGPWFNRLPAAKGAPLALLLVAALSCAGAWVVRWLDHALGLHVTGESSDLYFCASSAALTVVFGALALRYAHIQERWMRATRSEAQARFDALQARIQPHFLFNTLNTVSGLIRSRPDAAEEAVLDLADLMRAALARDGGRTRLREELDLARRYLSIEQLRLGDRLKVDWQVDENLPLFLPLPTLTLQPLVENAVLHGVAQMPGGGTVGRMRDGTVAASPSACAIRWPARWPPASPAARRKTSATGCGIRWVPARGCRWMATTVITR
ncbi:sensor histidine kinase [Pseudofulvimonas gallinarii]|uniref:sensor histidine kinase n=1 Tax=Pseudofulvimonas gallinarii TaxID=634155 RepID=UPI000F470D99|nr:sensor histidine kinase [Pseudofulvimonas gallinarii]